MMKATGLIFVFVLACGVVVAQNSNSSTTSSRERTTTNSNQSTTTQSPPKKAAPATAATRPTESESVLAAFDKLTAGIEHANVNEVMSVYWNSPQLNLFNYNGTVTKGWDQVRKNRESSYPQIKDVKLEVRDKSVHLLGRDGALVTCQWTQSQTYKGTPETVTGRMTLVFKRVGTAWKAIHLHSSPDTPDPSRIPPSEQPAASPSPKP